MADNLNFAKRSVKLGQISKNKTFKEAVVAIPFIEVGGKRSFFEIPYLSIKSTIDYVNGVTDVAPTIGDSIVDMVTKMKNYVIPPPFDFLTDSSTTPVAMYIFEFEHSFNQDDLSYIWQNLRPLGDQSVQKAQATINQENLKWMVFKIKQRSGYNYYDKLSDADKRYSFDFNVGRASTNQDIFANYSYNWPYDYFSMIESVKLEAEVEFSEGTGAKTEVETPTKGLARAADPALPSKFGS